MKSRIPKRKEIKTAEPHEGKTRPPEAPLNEGAAASYRKVQPADFQDHPRSSIEAAVGGSRRR